jgi:putative membrane protein
MANPEEPERDPRVYFAAERTFLAWIRTGLGLMGVGFAVARFGLFLRQMQSEETHMPIHSTGLSVWSGVALVALGVIVNPQRCIDVLLRAKTASPLFSWRIGWH